MVSSKYPTTMNNNNIYASQMMFKLSNLVQTSYMNSDVSTTSDFGFFSSHFKLRPGTSTTHNLVAIDVTIPPIQASLTDLPHSPKPKSCYEAHLQSERSKYSGRTSSELSGQHLIDDLNNHGVLLVPFTYTTFWVFKLNNR